MEKYIQREIQYSKSIKFDEETIEGIKDLYKSIDITPECSIVTENNIHYNFKNLDEVLQYDFSDKIKQIEIKNKEYSNTKKLRIIFEVDYSTGFFVYGKIVKLAYFVPDENKDILLKGKLQNFFKLNSTHNWIIGKFGFYILICIWVWPASVVQIIKSKINNEQVFPDISFKLVILCIIAFIFILLVRMIDKFNCKTFFEPIKYNIGKQKNKNEKVDKIKSNIFWGVIVAIVVGVITTIICNVILK